MFFLHKLLPMWPLSCLCTHLCRWIHLWRFLSISHSKSMNPLLLCWKGLCVYVCVLVKILIPMATLAGYALFLLFSLKCLPGPSYINNHVKMDLQIKLTVFICMTHLPFKPLTCFSCSGRHASNKISFSDTKRQFVLIEIQVKTR